jgi:hypothetical protein
MFKLLVLGATHAVLENVIVYYLNINAFHLFINTAHFISVYAFVYTTQQMG